MTPIALLAEARACGIELVLEPPDRIRVRGPRRALTAELQERLRAVKPELFALLGSEACRVRVRDAWSAAFGRLALLARASWPADGFGVVRWVRPEMARDMDRAEATADATGRFHVRGGTWEAFASALGRWEAVHAEALRLLDRLCHDCGREVMAAVVIDDGRRLCRGCLFPQDGPTAGGPK